MNKWTQEILDEFIGNASKEIGGITSVPRPGNYHVEIVSYLQNRIRTITGLKDEDIHIQGSGVDNIYFDLPASKGLENKDMVILQGHTDMVVAGMTEQDAQDKPIDAVLDGNTIHSKGFKTSLGADNGIGISIMLTIAKHVNDFKHGPLRFLMTADEDIGMVGAQALDPKWLIDPQGKQIKWLLNIDAEQKGVIYNGCAGNVRLFFTKNYPTTNPFDEGQELNYYQAYFNGLNGGHSAFDILKKRANADKLAFMLLNKLVNYAKLHSKIVRLVAMDHYDKEKQININYSANQLIANSRIVFATDIDSDTVEDFFSEIVKLCGCDDKQPYTGEDYDTVCSKSVIEQSSTGFQNLALLQSDTEILSYKFGHNDATLGDDLTSYYFGVFDDIAPNELIDAPNASGNIGPFEFRQNGISNITHLEGATSCRSSVKNQNDKLSIDWITDQYINLARSMGFEGQQIRKGPIYYPWPKDESNPLVQILKDGYEKYDVKPIPYSSPGGVEPTWWHAKSGGLITCACIGPTIQNAHSLIETLYIDTINPVMKTAIYALEQLTEK